MSISPKVTQVPEAKRDDKLAFDYNFHDFMITHIKPDSGPGWEDYEELDPEVMEAIVNE
jgi:hypothetical protein